ncbi:hypothetical protein BKA62DRAFT_826060 [Auriculariales sp. MPI-PUGE-AT-0066]|nr:hypothetical protein BKA62DRAFT_826060 [Auriculariales sp. MPI-PUGE-AT-0066]
MHEAAQQNLASFKATLSNLNGCISALDAEIVELERCLAVKRCEMDVAQTKRSDLEEKINRSLSEIYGGYIEYLMPDLLRCIFYQVCFEDRFNNYYALQPFQLAAVNRHWRSVALSTPRIWAHVVAGPTIFFYSWTEADVSRVQLLLERSQSAPLHVYFPIIRGHFLLPMDCFSRAFKLAAKNMSRWKHAYVRYTAWHGGNTNDLDLSVNQHFKSLHGQKPNLTHLDIETRTSAVDATPFLIDAPSLRSLCIAGNIFHSVPVTGFPCITKLTIKYLDNIKTLISFLIPCAPTLQSLRLNNRDDAADAKDPSLSITLPVLRKLKLFGNIPHDEYGLVLPALQYLSLSRTYLFESCTVFLRSVADTVIHLKMVNFLTSDFDSDMLEILSVLQNVKQLEFGIDWTTSNGNGIAIKDGVFKYLTERVPPMWPALQSISIANASITDGSSIGDELVALVQHRNPPLQDTDHGSHNQVLARLTSVKIAYDGIGENVQRDIDCILRRDRVARR